ncbi:hypothetical protein RHGRI_008376 [Rhododendron griersonianum]|uniref:Uncharacterized protein n=1 Tax=Rhododendron griersonianum TaxID=479676 RepID=A0AAV6L157_9ERIC|nr:hypothetical protein RHGRI_008376 [Rhododendron griersonianum]
MLILEDDQMMLPFILSSLNEPELLSVYFLRNLHVSVEVSYSLTAIVVTILHLHLLYGEHHMLYQLCSSEQTLVAQSDFLLRVVPNFFRILIPLGLGFTHWFSKLRDFLDDVLEEESDKIFFDNNTSSFQSEIDWESPPRFDEYADDEFEISEANVIEDIVHVAIQEDGTVGKIIDGSNETKFMSLDSSSVMSSMKLLEARLGHVSLEAPSRLVLAMYPMKSSAMSPMKLLESRLGHVSHEALSRLGSAMSPMKIPRD